MFWTKYILRIIAAMCLSALAASLVITAMLVKQSAGGTLWEYLSVWIGVAIFTGIMALPALIIAIIWSELKSVRTWWFFMACGGAVALLWFIILAGDDPVSEFVDSASYMIMILASGFGGGAAYWWLAGRYAGSWKDK